MVWMKIAVFWLYIQNQILPIFIFLNYTTDQVQVGSAYESSPLVQVNSNKCKQNYKLIPMSISICIVFFLLRPKHLKVKENNRHTVISTCMAASYWPLCLSLPLQVLLMFQKHFLKYIQAENMKKIKRKSSRTPGKRGPNTMKWIKVIEKSSWKVDAPYVSCALPTNFANTEVQYLQKCY